MNDENVFSEYEIIKTLSCTKLLSDVSRTTGINSTQVTIWEKEAKNKSETIEYYALFMLEYFRRIDFEETRMLEKKYMLSPNVDEAFITTHIFPKEVLSSYLSSSVKWKPFIVHHLMSQNRTILKEQLAMIDIFILCRYGIKKDRMRLDTSTLSSVIDPKFLNNIKHL